MDYEQVRARIISKYEQFVDPLVGAETQLGGTLISGLDGILKDAFGLRNYTSMEPRTVPDKFQLTIGELSELEIPNPNEVYDVNELRALYGKLGARADYCTGFVASRGSRTVGHMKESLLGYRTKWEKSRSSYGIHNFGKKTALTMEDYLIFKSGSQK